MGVVNGVPVGVAVGVGVPPLGDPGMNTTSRTMIAMMTAAPITCILQSLIFMRNLLWLNHHTVLLYITIIYITGVTERPHQLGYGDGPTTTAALVTADDIGSRA